MRVACIGGGPAGLYFAISMKLRDPRHEVTVIERNRPDDTFGWGVVFSDQTMEHLRRNDPASADRILDSFAHWDDIEVHFRGEVVRSGGHGFCGIARKRLLAILQERARELGVALRFETEADDPAQLAGYDLIVAADGINSRIRGRYEADFGVQVERRANKFVWLGTHRLFDAFTFIFTETPHGWFWAHAYRFDRDTSTFIVECQEETWRRAGLDTMEQAEAVAFCEGVFAEHLQGHPLLSNARHLRGAAAWINFPRIHCERWSRGNLVLLGDAAHTAHFSIGSGTKLALEDAIALADALRDHGDLPSAFAAYEAERRTEVLKLQSAARNSTEWFEQVPRHTALEPMQFAYALLTRSQRVSHENLRLRDRGWLEGVERWFQGRARGEAPAPGTNAPAVPPMFAPFRLRGMELANRIVVSPMCMYSAVDGVPDDFHLVHYGARAQGGAGLIFTEMTDVSADGRITPGCTGLYTDAQQAAWTRIVDFVHRHSRAKFALQLAHAGRKGSTKVPWEGEDQPLDAGNWPLIAPSAIPYAPHMQVPRAMEGADFDRVEADFVAAARRGAAAGFDMLELHCGHGYLLSSFITPLSNRRTDEYGGSLENRLRFPLRIFRALRAVWPEARPMSVRISATDWVEGGITADDAVRIAIAFREAGADIVDTSTGQTSPDARPVYGRMYQTPYADRIRNEAGIPTIAVGNIYEPDHVNSILAAGRADLCCLARPHLGNPFWTLQAAAQLGYREQEWPVQYRSGKVQMERNLQRAAEAI
ncbi:MAG TPA: bifunctional salicylyl-CoA 5-hydroxylase/oxidoreductase [Alphaproteobacteria bacterium]|nr:bifunctional salicylyl-CoA 5-hydroxylase/oxidoreductase [Alphaproteobacteria bacterium]